MNADAVIQNAKNAGLGIWSRCRTSRTTQFQYAIRHGLVPIKNAGFSLFCAGEMFITGRQPRNRQDRRF